MNQSSTMRLLKKSLFAAVIVVFAIMPATMSAQRCNGLTGANHVQNPGFELGHQYTVTDWTVAWNSTADPYFYIGGNPHSGTQAMWLGAIPGTNKISQPIPSLTAGAVYTLCFYLSNNTSSNPGSFEAIWNDVDVVHMAENAGFGYQYYSVNVVAIGGGKDVLAFQARQVPSFYYLDDVSLQLCSTCSLYSPQNGTKPLPDDSE